MKFRNIISEKEMDIDFSNEKINLIIGKNGTGKSNILRSIEQNTDVEVLSIHKDTKLLDLLRFIPNDKNQKTLKLEKIGLKSVENNSIKMLPQIDWKLMNDDINSVNFMNYTTINYFDGSFKFHNGAGDGNEKMIMINILQNYLKSRRREVILLIDEPENHLHPSLFSDFLILLKKIASYKKTTVIISTHSEKILKKIYSESFVFATKRIRGSFEINRITFNTNDFLTLNKTLKKHQSNSLKKKNYLDLLKEKLNLNEEELGLYLNGLIPEIVSSLSFYKNTILGEGIIEKNIEHYLNDTNVLISFGKLLHPFYIYALNNLKSFFNDSVFIIMYDLDYNHSHSPKSFHQYINNMIDSFIDKRNKRIITFKHNIECEIWKNCNPKEKKGIELKSRNCNVYEKYIKKQIKPLIEKN